MDDAGGWKSTEEIEQHFSTLSKDKDIIVYCGSGVSACPNVLALEEAGYRNVKLYGGSWSDWISYKENRIATGDEKSLENI
ncbi:sulfurtransferase [Paenibacillus faecalis]|uniref:sulfurtransferase n=1 Tax=Paenibacillus faecalis TaxID=2079532 RepID=UPI00307695A5